MFRVIVAGSRDFQDYNLLRNTLDYLLQNKFPHVEIVSGTAKGADRLGEKYAMERGLKIKQFPANWDLYKKQAGYIRNVEMARYADACVCFWNRKSRGTMHMINIAKEYGLDLRIIYYRKENCL